jgi:cytochrome c oxidase cbb3-type subunit 3
MALRFAAVRDRSGAAMRVLATAARAALACAAATAALAATTSCLQAPSAESLREWSPADHHSNDDDKLAQQRAQQPRKAAPQAGARAAKAGSDPAQIAQLVEMTWRQQCSSCHGTGGRGDGQMGPMVHATDLTSPDWQKKTSDGDMAVAIKAGKGRMPRFDLPDSVVAGLVTRIRALASPAAAQ